jgi:hypothetical protein
MNWLRRLWSRVTSWRREIEEPFDMNFPDSTPPGYSDSAPFGRFVPESPPGMEAPDTMPTSPGALDSDLSRLEP